MAEKVCRLYLVRYQRGETPWDEIVIKHMKLIQKRHFSQSMFPFTLGISFVNLNESVDSFRSISIKKGNF